MINKNGSNIQRILAILLFFSISHVFGQRDLKINIDDFNNDKVIDTLKTFYEGGSGFGGRYVQIVNGKTNEMYELTNDGCFCDIKSTILIPPKLAKKENARFLEIMITRLLPKKRNNPDASLDWMIKSAYANVSLKNNPFFNLIIDPQIEWIQGEFKAPENYYMEIEGDSLMQLYSTPYEAPEWLDAKNAKGFLMYYANKHYRNREGDSIRLSDSNATYKVYNTSHGVYVQKENTYKWLFISDVSTTGAPLKLRWESIKGAKLFGKYVVVQQHLPIIDTDELFVINIETGICGRLNYDLPDANITAIENLLEKETGNLTAAEKQVMAQLKAVFKELENHYITKKTNKK